MENEIQKARINGFGDVVCPHCKINIITPPGYILQAGISVCPICDKKFELTTKILNQALKKIKEKISGGK